MAPTPLHDSGAAERSFPQLSPAQAKAALAMAHGQTVTKAAAAAGVHRTSIYHWFKTDKRFQAAAAELHLEIAMQRKDEMRELDALALDTPAARPQLPDSVLARAERRGHIHESAIRPCDPEHPRQSLRRFLSA
jgi:AcrR family transcriptional regulator